MCLVHPTNAVGKVYADPLLFYANVNRVILVWRDEEARVRTMVLWASLDLLRRRAASGTVQPPQLISTESKILTDNDEASLQALMSALAEHAQRASPSLNLFGVMRGVRADYWHAADSKNSKQGGQNAACAIDDSGSWLARFNLIGRADPCVWWTRKPLSSA